jgi:DNA-binding NarL/FixJ family response regulator
VLLDISMPGMSGFAVARHLRQAMPGVVLIFVTQHAQREYVDAAFAAGAAGYVLKGKVVQELSPAISQVRAGGHYVSPALLA